MRLVLEDSSRSRFLSVPPIEGYFAAGVGLKSLIALAGRPIHPLDGPTLNADLAFEGCRRGREGLALLAYGHVLAKHEVLDDLAPIIGGLGDFTLVGRVFPPDLRFSQLDASEFEPLRAPN